MSECKFAQCIVDECGMCSEPETLIPIVTACAKEDDDCVSCIAKVLG